MKVRGPLGERRADLRMGIMVSNLLAPHLKRDAKMPVPTDFMPFEAAPIAKPAPTTTPDLLPATEILKIFRAMPGWRKASA